MSSSFCGSLPRCFHLTFFLPPKSAWPEHKIAQPKISRTMMRQGKRLLAWDPWCPAQLTVYDPVEDPRKDGKDANGSQPLGLDMNTIRSDASGCNAHELAALIKILHAHKEYKQDGGGCQLRSEGDRMLSETCRKAIQECLEGWEKEEQQNDRPNSVEAGNEKDSAVTSHRNQEFLKLSMQVIHLSDIFFPLLMSPPWTGRSLAAEKAIITGNPWLSFSGTDAFHMPGAVTAPLVRFLRYHFDSPVLHQADWLEMLEATQPELYESSMPLDNASSGSLYWAYVEACVLRGCLEQAWDALQRHSLYQQAKALLHQQSQEMENNTQDKDDETSLHNTALELVRGFASLKRLLSLAPLPGGRTDAYDDQLCPPPYHHSFLNDDPDDDDETNGYDEWNVNVDWYVRGLRVSEHDYRLWELGGGGDSSRTIREDFPVDFVPEAAMRKHATWQEYLQVHVLSSATHPITRLSNRIPQLQRIFKIMLGRWHEEDHDTMISGDETRMIQKVYVPWTCWAEHMCAKLLYQLPYLKPRHAHDVAMKCIKHAATRLDKGAETTSFMDAGDQVLLDIMEGRISQCLHVLNQLGGASGAALPATLVSPDSREKEGKVVLYPPLS